MRCWITPARVAPAAAVVALVGACQATTESPATTAPPIITTTTASTTSMPATTSTLAEQASSTMVYKADAATLQPLPGLEAIGTGDAAGGVASPDGRWLALSLWREEVIDELILIDTASWEVVQRSPSWGRIVGVDDEGTVYAVRTNPTILVRRLLIEYADWDTGTGFDSAGPWDVDVLGPGILGGLLYPTTASERTGEEPMLIVVDTRTGEVDQVPLPGLQAGGVPTEIVLEGGDRVFETYEPEVVWDGDRALVVHADEDAVTEVNLATGETLRHDYVPEASIWDRFLLWLSPPAQAKGPSAGVTRSATPSSNGDYLYVSGYRQDVFIDAEGKVHETLTPMGIDVVDTKRWVLEARLDLPVGRVRLSPDGSTLIGTGWTEVGISNRFEMEGSGIYFISTTTLEYEHLDGSPDWETGVDFAPDGSYLYVTDATRGDTIDIVNPETLETVASIQGCWLEIWGAAGVVYEWTGCRTNP